MNSASRRILGLIGAVFAATLLQAEFADPLRIGPAVPDFITSVAIIGSLFCSTEGAGALGLFAGLMLASLGGPPHGGFGSILVSRTLVCAMVGALETRVFRDSVLAACILTAVGTALAECLFFLFAPQHYILHWARGMAFTTLYNTLLAWPLYRLVRLFAVSRED